MSVRILYSHLPDMHAVRLVGIRATSEISVLPTYNDTEEGNRGFRVAMMVHLFIIQLGDNPKPKTKSDQLGHPLSVAPISGVSCSM